MAFRSDLGECGVWANRCPPEKLAENAAITFRKGYDKGTLALVRLLVIFL